MPMDVYHPHINNTMYQTVYSLFLPFFFSSGDYIKELEHLGSALQEALTTISLSWSGFLLTAL